MLIAPLQFGIGEALEKMNSGRDRSAGDKLTDSGGLRPGHADDDQRHIRIDAAKSPELRVRANQQRNVLVAAMLRNAEQEHLALRRRNRRRGGAICRGFDAVVNANGFSRGNPGRMVKKSEVCSL